MKKLLVASIMCVSLMVSSSSAMASTCAPAPACRPVTCIWWIFGTCCF